MNHDSNVFLMQMITAERMPLQECKTCALAHAPHRSERKQMYEEIGGKTTWRNRQKMHDNLEQQKEYYVGRLGGCFYTPFKKYDIDRVAWG